MTKICSLSIKLNVNIYFIKAAEDKNRFITIYDNVDVNLNEIIIKILIFVIKEAKYDLILKYSYERKI